MDRGPVALFVSIVAVGLGPALWLGVQFGTVEIAPVRQQPVVSEQRPDGQELLGGTGAGSAATADGESIIRTTPRSDSRPIPRSASPSPSGDPATTDPEPTGSPSETADPGDDPTPTDTAPTGEPSQPGTDEPDDPTIAPEPPVFTTDPTEPSDEGGIGAGDNLAGGQGASAGDG
jgi:hypothetical protein